MCMIFLGMKELSFVSMNDFQSWKESEEESTYSTCVKGQQMYHRSIEGVFSQTRQACIIYLLQG